MIEAPFELSPLFEWNYRSTKPICVNQGGTSSGKTYSILQVLIMKALEAPNQVITVVGQDFPNLKVGAVRDFENIINTTPFFSRYLCKSNKMTATSTFINGSIIEFNQYDNEQDAKSGKRTYLFVNEANGIPYSVYDQLQIRTEKQVFIDYNPTAPFWVHDKLIGREDVDLFISNYSHNPFLKPQIKEKIEALREIDPHKWRVYGLGLTGEVQGVVFPKVEWIPKLPTDNIKRTAYGMDFGYTNDPTTLVKIVLSEGKLYGKLLLYSTNLTNQDIGKELKRLGLKKGLREGDMIIADSAEPKSIKELRILGWRVKGSKKGSDSIKYGINQLKSYGVLNLVQNSKWKEEQQRYIWTVDRKDGRVRNKPVDKFNHIWDALRYGEQGISKRISNKIIYT